MHDRDVVPPKKSDVVPKAGSTPERRNDDLGRKRDVVPEKTHVVPKHGAPKKLDGCLE